MKIIGWKRTVYKNTVTKSSRYRLIQNAKEITTSQGRLIKVTAGHQGLMLVAKDSRP